ncbi:MAG: DUF2807 domain-containing protein [Chitinophagaceae bacterium]|nr:DUF2807 domain-containing protein [Chitinophagaceae bacterium]
MNYTAHARNFKRLILFVLPLLVILGSCRNFMGKRVRGNGNIRTEERPVQNFKEVEVGGAAKVMVSQGDKPLVKVETDDNLLQYIEVFQEGDKVFIKEKSGFNLRPSGDINVYVTSPVYSRISASGACDIIGQNKISNPEDLHLHVTGAGDIKMEVDAPTLSAEVSGSGNINLKGQTKNVDLELTGAGHAHCYDLLAENTKVEISGAGSAEVYASVKLDATVSGAGNVNYKGNASEVNQHVSGAGNVKKVSN